jgi:hypothetical protein
MECVCCGEKLESTYVSFTGVCNFSKGQYIKFYYCPNKECIRFELYCHHNVGERR